MYCKRQYPDRRRGPSPDKYGVFGKADRINSPDDSDDRPCVER